MPTLDEIREMIDDYNSPALQIDGHDNAIIGAGMGGLDGDYILVYSKERIIQNLMDQGMDRIEAIEYFDFNIDGAYLGPGTPIIIDEREDSI
jgi:hypothetical protein